MKDFLERLRGIWSPHPGQRGFLLSPAKIKVLACGRRWGKTDACAAQVLAAMHGSKPSRQLLLAPTLDQARMLFERVIELLRALVQREGRPEPQPRLTPYPKLAYEGNFLSARSGHVGRSLRGAEAHAVIVDEAAYVPGALITDVAMPMMATTGGVLTLISTPNGKNHFWRYFEMGRQGEHGVWSATAPSWESPRVQPAYLEIQRKLLSERSFAVEYGAEFLDSAGQVFRSEAIEGCRVPEIVGPVEGPFWIGVDWAQVRDWTTVAVLGRGMGGAVLCEATRIPRGSWEAMIEQVAAQIWRYSPAVVVSDATGLGSPMTEALGRLGIRVIGERFTAEVKRGLVENLVRLFETGGIRFTLNPELERELAAFTLFESGSGQVRYEAAAGEHDDLVMALALAASRWPRPSRLQIVSGPRRWF